jgi:hypothetical protein
MLKNVQVRSARVLEPSPLFTIDHASRDCIPFYEYFNGDTGEGLGAGHQKGWTALVASLLKKSAMF